MRSISTSSIPPHPAHHKTPRYEFVCWKSSWTRIHEAFCESVLQHQFLSLNTICCTFLHINHKPLHHHSSCFWSSMSCILQNMQKNPPNMDQIHMQKLPRGSCKVRQENSSQKRLVCPSKCMQHINSGRLKLWRSWVQSWNLPVVKDTKMEHQSLRRFFCQKSGGLVQ